MRHVDPYKILNPNDHAELIFNSSHPELNERKRVVHFGAYTFDKPEHLDKFFKEEQIKVDNYKYKFEKRNNGDGTHTLHVHLVEKHKG